MNTTQQIPSIIEAQRSFFRTGATRSISARILLLQQLYKAIRKHEEDICKALAQDLGKSPTEAFMTEIGMTLKEISSLSKGVRRWSKPIRERTWLVNLPGSSWQIPEPYGVALVMAPWNYPFMLCIEPMIGAVAAGNCCVLKPSDYSPATSRIIREIVAEVFPPAYVTTVLGGRKENAALLEERFDYIFFTGGDVVGRLVMEKAAKHLTPVSLELGGKSPCVVTRDADLKLAAKRVAFGKYLNCGQTCVAPDYLLIDRRVKTEFLALFKEAVAAMYGRDPLKNRDYGRIINLLT